jgi:hypothetical protein
MSEFPISKTLIASSDPPLISNDLPPLYVEYTIPKTLIASSDPPNICNGLALFPPFPSFGAGIHTGGQPTALIDTNKRVLAVRGSASVSFSFFMGLCGPGYGVKTYLEGKMESKKLTLDYGDDEFVGGFAMGMNARASINANIQVYKLRWHKHAWHPTGEWDAELSVSANIEFDLVKLIFDVLAALVQAESFVGTLIQKTEPVSDAFKTSLAILDGETGKWPNYNDGEVSIDPKFTVPINLWPLLVNAAVPFAETPFGEAVLGVNAVLCATMSSLGIGPTFGVGIPLTLKISKVALDGTEYTNPQTVPLDPANASYGQHYGWSGTADRVLDKVPTSMTVTFQHNAGFSLHLGLFASVQILEFIHASVNVDVAILKVLNIAPQPQPFEHNLSNSIGLTHLASASRKMMAGFETMDVEFA